MEILIYVVLPCVGSIFLLGGMFYAAYRISGQEGMPRLRGVPRQKEMPRQKRVPGQKAMSWRENTSEGKTMPLRENTSEGKTMPLRENTSEGKAMPRRENTSEGKAMPWWKNLPRRALGIIPAYILVCVVLSSLGSTWVNLATLFLFPLIACWAYGTPKIYCLYYLILSVAVWLTDIAGVLALQILLARGILYLNLPELQYILMMTGTRMAEFMVMLLVSMAAGRKAGRHITVRQVILSVLLPLYSIFNMYCMLYMAQIFPTGEILLLLGLNLVLLIGLNIYFCVLVDVISENHRLEGERNLYRAQARMQHQYYEQEEEKYEASRKLIHDIRNHIQAMEALYSREHAGEEEGGHDCGNVPGAVSGIANGEASGAAVGETDENILSAASSASGAADREADGDISGGANGNALSAAKGEADEDVSGNVHSAKRYAGEIHQMLNSFQHKYYTSEKLLNIILNDKARMMQRLGVREDMKVGELNLDFMKDTDVTALFANLLDNAVAAAAESQEGFVRLRVNRVRQFLSIMVENSCDQEPVRAAGTFRSHKTGHQGLGLKIIRQTVEQYGGDVQLDWKDGVFTARIMLTAEDGREPA